MLFLLPNFVGFLVFMLGPILLSLYMAFTNWSLRPNVELEHVWLRNFADLLGIYARGTGGVDILMGYGIGLLLILLSLMGLFLSRINLWTGVRWGGLITCAAALGIGGTWAIEGGNHVYALIAVALFFIGWTGARNSEADWALGKGLAPPLMLAAGVLLVYLLNDPMWRLWELRDRRFWYFFYNTLYLMMGIPFSIAGSLAFALLLNHRFPALGRSKRYSAAALFFVLGGATFMLVSALGRPDAGLLGGILWWLAALGVLFNVVAFRTMFYLPKFTAGVALMILWKALYNPETGPINVALENAAAWVGLELDGPRWLASVVWAKPALVIMTIWFTVGGTNMLLYLAGLSNVPQDLLDAAEVDGAGIWKRFRHVTWPQLAPTTFFISIMSVIGGLQGGFEQARVMTNGGPAGATTTLSFYIYNKAFQDLDLGYAAAISWILFAVIFAATAFNWRFGRDLEVE
jgi:ABC-type sugar transport system permease subunit